MKKLKRLIRILARSIPFLIVGGITLALFLFPDLFGHADASSKPKEKGPTPVRTVPAIRGNLIETYQTVGTAAGRSEVKVTSQVEGVLQTVTAEVGASVKTGQTLAELDDRLSRAGMAQAQASLKLSGEELKRATQLSEKGIADQKRLQAAVAQEQIDQANLDKLRVQLSLSQFPSPLDGIVTARLVDPGDTVRNGAHLFTVVDVGRMFVRVTVPEGEAARLKSGAAAVLTVDALGGRELPATVHHVYPSADPVSHQTTVELDAGEAFPELKPGYLVKVRLTLAERAQALTLDRGAVAEIRPDGTARLFVVGGEQADKAEARTVRFGLILEDRVEVLSGLEEGDQVVWRGNSLKDGAAVRVSNKTPTTREAAQ